MRETQINVVITMYPLTPALSREERERIYPYYAAPVFPVCRAEHRSFYRDQPEGVRQGCRTSAEGLGSPFCRPSIKASARRIKAASGPPFLWILSFGGAKESISPSGASTRLNQAVAIATHYVSFPYFHG